MFYVYFRQYYPVWEPAEGGYYVAASKVTDYYKTNCINKAIETMRSWIEDCVAEGETINDVSYEYGFVTDEDGDVTLKLPFARLSHTCYVGEGFDVGIATEKPEDRPYQGYC